MASSQPTTNRLEAFSDGVIAVIITIMVLELKVPHAPGMDGLREILPILLVYLLSFSFTGIYWINHHQLLDRIHEVDARVLYSNLLFLFCLSLLPFFTSWMIERHIDTFSVTLYAASLIVSGTGFFLLRLAVERRQRLNGTHAATDRAEQRKHLLSLALYLLAIPLATLMPCSPSSASRSSPSSGSSPTSEPAPPPAASSSARVIPVEAAPELSFPSETRICPALWSSSSRTSALPVPHAPSLSPEVRPERREETASSSDMPHLHLHDNPRLTS